MSASPVTLVQALTDAAGTRPLDARGGALMALATVYAEHIDAAVQSGDTGTAVKVIADLGPKFQAALAGLGLVLAGAYAPGAAGGAGPPGPGAQPADELARLRERAAQRSV